MALAFGLALLVIASSLGHISGAHVNPAVTIGLAAGRRFPWRFVAPYVCAQIIGGCLGALATWAVFGTAARATAHLGATYLAASAGVGRALLVEALITFVLVLVVVAVATDERVPPATTSIGVGVALAVAVFIGGPISGGAANPARALGPMIVAGKLTSFWVYIVGPVIGGVVAAAAYNVISVARPPE